jgi:hypothetical protein
MPSTAPLALLDELLWDLAGLLHAKLPSTSGDDAAVGMSVRLGQAYLSSMATWRSSNGCYPVGHGLNASGGKALFSGGSSNEEIASI